MTQTKKKGGKKDKKEIQDNDFETAEVEVSPGESTAEVIGKKKGGKKGKKGAKVDDDEFEIAQLVDVEPALVDVEPVSSDVNTFQTKKKGGKKEKKALQVDDDEFEVLDNSIEEIISPSENPITAEFSGKKKGGKKGKKAFQVDDDEFPILDSTVDEPSALTEETNVLEFMGKKKGGKKGKKGLKVDDDEYELSISNGTATENLADSTLGEEPTSGGSKKKAGQKGLSKVDAFALPAEFDEGSVEPNEVDEDRAHDSISVVLEDNGNMSSDEIVFSGKKKSKGKKGTRSQDVDLSYVEILDESLQVKAMQEVTSFQESLPDGDAEVDSEEIVFFGKKKAKKGKKDSKKELEVEDDTQVNETPVAALITSGTPQSSSLIPEPTDVKKKGKKGKKSSRTAQEEEDLDAILAELEGPKVLKTQTTTSTTEMPTEAFESLDTPAELEEIYPATIAVESEEVVESAAAKKKKKKKEKEREKKAAAVEKTPEEDTSDIVKPDVSKAKTVEKKIPKHLKAMQEQLLKIKEAEERRKREEEEKQRKEEEEQARLEELERQKEEAKRRRKEREKEKLLLKKKEGKLLTGKQKDEARRLAQMREQMLAQAGLPNDGDLGTVEESEGVPRPRKPKYETKKKRKPPGGQQSSELFADAGGLDTVDMHVEFTNVKDDDEIAAEVDELEEVEVVIEEEHVEEEVLEEKIQEPEEDEEEQDWDAKSFEDVALPAIKSAFAEDEVEDEKKPVLVPVVGKVTKKVSAQTAVTPLASKRAASPEKRTAAVTVKRPQQVQQRSQPNRKIAPPAPEESEEEQETESEEESESEEEDNAETRKRRLAKEKREARKAEALTKRSADDLRSPICCILGHVDTGKTKLLDCIRRTNVQEGEAGGITQQIGATYFPMKNIQERTKELNATANMRVPGLLVIDTPGHESFTNLRARGSSLCDIAILVIDIMHGLEPQTIESLKLLQMRKTPFIVALNKVDRLYDWRSIPNGPIQNSLNLQGKHVEQEFETRTNSIITQLKEQGMNSELYYRNKQLRKYISIVPTSAISGEGIPDLLMLLIQLTQKMMEEKLMYVSEVQCTVLEVKMIEGLGTTIDVVLVNGVLHEGDHIVVCGMQGPIVTNIRALLTPHPMKELRVKGSYEKHKQLKAAQGIKITAQGLEHAIAGTQLYVVGPDDDLDDIKDEAMEDMKTVMNRVDKSGEGVCVQASTLGSLEALLEFLKSPAVKIPVSGINIGPVHKKDVMRASVMLERKRKDYATILAFDVKVTQEAKELADEVGVKIFTADIIYHLFDQFTNYINTVKEEKRKESAEEAVFPCVLKILPGCVFNKKDPIIVGVDVVEGIAKVGTPICIPSREFIEIGRIASIEVNHKVVDTARKGGQSVAIKIIGTNAEETQKMYGRHFEHEDELVSSITRRSIDLLKENYRDDLAMDDWKLLVKLKVKIFLDVRRQVGGLASLMMMA